MWHDDASEERRIGLIVPSSNTAVEVDLRAGRETCSYCLLVSGSQRAIVSASRSGVTGLGR